MQSAVQWVSLHNSILDLTLYYSAIWVAAQCIQVQWLKLNSTSAQCADSEVRNAFERTPYVVVQKFHVFILISKSFNFRSSLERILRYLTKTWLYTLNFKKIPCWWLSIGYWVIENDSVSDTRHTLLLGPWSFKICHLWNRWPWPNIIGCLF